MKLRRGDIVLIVAPGAFGKARPAVIVQADMFNADPPSITVCLVTSHAQIENPVRISLPTGKSTGLDLPSQAQADKLMTLLPGSIRKRLGSVPATTMRGIDAAIRLWLDL